ncbi:MAG: hypothetical protein AB1439_12785 [candidate division FCPU426 bacterium]
MRSETESALGAVLKRHSLTEITTDRNTGETEKTYSLNDRGDKVWTVMDEDGLAVRSETESALGAVRKRNSVTTITNNRETGETSETLNVNDRGDRVWTGMDGNGLAVRSESWQALGAGKKRHAVTAINTDTETGETRATSMVNDLGDRSATNMDRNGLAVGSENWRALGAGQKKHHITRITTDPNTGETAETADQNDRGDETLTVMDENGLAVSSKSRMALGALQKRGSTTLIQTDAYTGETAMTCNLNERGDMAWTAMDEDGLAVKSRSLAALGATLKRNSLTAIETDAETGETAATSSMNDRGDFTATAMDENGLATDSVGTLSLGAVLKRRSVTEIKTNQETGETAETVSVNDRGDRTWSGMDRDGLAMASETWQKVGALLKRHSLTEIRTDRYTGETSSTRNVNDRGDRTLTVMDRNGLAVAGENWLALGARQKRHSVIEITTDADTGETRKTYSLNDRGDKVWTAMDEDGLAVRSETESALGAVLKRHSLTEITTDRNTGETEKTYSLNDRGDKVWTAMDEDGLAVRSVTQNALGAVRKRNSVTTITNNRETGETSETLNVNDRGDKVWTGMDGNGLAVRSESWQALGARAKRHSVSAIQTDPETGETRATDTTNDRGDRTMTQMNEQGLAAGSESWLALGPKAKRHHATSIATHPDTGETTATLDRNDRGDLILTLMDRNGLAVQSDSHLALGAELKKHSLTDISTDPATGETTSTLSLNDRQDMTYTIMDQDGLATLSLSRLSLGAIYKRLVETRIDTDRTTGETAATNSINQLGDRTVTQMDRDGTPVRSESWLSLGPTAKRHTVSEIHTADTGEISSTVSTNDLGERTITEMDANGLAVFSESWTTLGARKKRHSAGRVTTDARTGEIAATYSKNDLQEETWTTMDENGLPVSSRSLERLGPENGREKNSQITADRYTGVTREVSTRDGLHDGPAVTRMDGNGIVRESEGRDLHGPRAGRLKHTRMIPDPGTGLTRETFTTDGLHAGEVHTLMDENGFARSSTGWAKHGPDQGRYQETSMEADEETGMTIRSTSRTLSGPGGTLVTEAATQNDPEYGTPVSSVALSSFGAYKEKQTAFVCDTNTGLIEASLVEDEGGTTRNQHNEYGITSSRRDNLLGAIRTITTTNTLDEQTGMPLQSASVDRKGQTTSQYNAEGLNTTATRANTGAHFIVTETTRVQTWNPYTGSPLYAIATDAHGKTHKYSDLDGFLEKAERVDEWGERTVTTYTNNRLTGMPTYSLSQAATGSTQTWYEDNGLALRSSFKATVGLHSETVNYYDAQMDISSAKSTDERGNVTVNAFNAAGEVTHSYSKNGTTVMDMANNRAASSSGPNGSTTYYYSGRWMDQTVNEGDEGTTTTWYDHRHNGAANKVQTKDGTTTYTNTYNSRGFVTYRTESNGKDSGFSRFNQYGDQEYTEWSGKIPADPPDKYGNQFLGGSWKSVTTYKHNDRGDMLSWTTDSSWSGTVHYAEIGHYIFKCTKGYDNSGACLGGEEQYVVDQAAHNKGVGGSESKTEGPKHAPESDDWILSHLQGTRPTGVALARSKTKSGGIVAASVKQRDATEADYHSVDQKRMASLLARQGYAEELKGQYAGVVQSLDDLLLHFSRTGEAMSLKRIASYQYADLATFDEELKRAKDKTEFLWQTVDGVYYYFSGAHLSEEQLTRSSLTRAYCLTDRAPSTAVLQDWIKFTLPAADQKTAGAMLSQAAHELKDLQDARLRARRMDILCETLAGLLSRQSRSKLGVYLSPAGVKEWLTGVLDSPKTVSDVSGMLASGQGGRTGARRAGEGVSLGGALETASASGKARQGWVINPERLGYIKPVGVAAASAQGTAAGAAAKSGETQSSGEAKPRDQRPSEAKNERGFDELVKTHRLSLRREQHTDDAGEKKLDREGRVVQTARSEGGTKTFAYPSGTKTVVKFITTDGRTESEARYEQGWLQSATFEDGSKLDVTYKWNANKQPETVDVRLVKKEEERIYKYDAHGRLLNVLAKDGGRMKVVSQSQEREPLEELSEAIKTQKEILQGKHFDDELIQEPPKVRE